MKLNEIKKMSITNKNKQEKAVGFPDVEKKSIREMNKSLKDDLKIITVFITH